MKFSILDILESFFQPEAAKQTNNSAPRDASVKGSLEFPYNTEDEDFMSDKEIGKELKLELKLGNVMKDPKNLPSHNLHNGSFSWGKASRPFGNYQLKSSFPEDSQIEVMVRPIEEGFHDPEAEEQWRKEADREIIKKSGTTPEDLDEQIKKAIENRNRARKEAEAARRIRRFASSRWEDARSPVKEGVGMRDRARGVGTQMTTKQPFANGVPKETGSDFMGEDEIIRELGLSEVYNLMEWINSSLVFNQKSEPEEAELDFFNNNRPQYVMNTEEEFNQNQRKKVSDEKKEKKQKKHRR